MRTTLRVAKVKSANHLHPVPFCHRSLLFWKPRTVGSLRCTWARLPRPCSSLPFCCDLEGKFIIETFLMCLGWAVRFVTIAGSMEIRRTLRSLARYGFYSERPKRPTQCDPPDLIFHRCNARQWIKDHSLADSMWWLLITYIFTIYVNILVEQTS